MKSALSIIAFSKGCDYRGTFALLETALAALDGMEESLPAIFVDQALVALRSKHDRWGEDFDNLDSFG